MIKYDSHSKICLAKTFVLDSDLGTDTELSCFFNLMLYQRVRKECLHRSVSVILSSYISQNSRENLNLV